MVSPRGSRYAPISTPRRTDSSNGYGSRLKSSSIPASIPEGYIPLSIGVAPLEGLVVGEPRWPAPHPYRVEGLDEALSVYEGNVAVSLPLTFTQEGADQTLHVTVRYQACSDTDCFLPSTIALQVPVKAADLVERPRRQ